MTFSLEILETSLGALNDQLDVLDNKLSSLERISDHSFFELYILAQQMNVSLADSLLTAK
ncbi:hypothetical protein EHS13_11010 [Paenibacillus psychroresistens]|uniref:Uncharacterized protein n=1 Tax=Paenibacillus psychroresistens TaxID=1778678 RepID=A0A6B8RJ11_9BACL|nr:hypothetical protein [Paenibacillus psychroresistens]QGQ95376.1 hypothetical protein EHS13_11010 [Paenibacillus psychroresistens]